MEPKFIWGPLLPPNRTQHESAPLRNIREVVPEDLHQDETVLTIEHYENEAVSHEKAKRYITASECLEESIVLRRRFLSEMHPEYVLAIERYVCNCNHWGMLCLEAGQHTMSLGLLKKAEAMTGAENVANFKRRMALRAVTYNNIYCFFRTRGKLNAALRCVAKALRIEQKYKETENPAWTHVNYGVLLSLMGRHSEALTHNESAIALLLGEQLHQTQPRGSEAVVSLVLAYHNMWVELSRLKRYEAGADSLDRASYFATLYLGADHSLTSQIVQRHAASKPFMVKINQVKAYYGMGADDENVDIIEKVSERLPAIVKPNSPLDSTTPRSPPLISDHRDAAAMLDTNSYFKPKPPVFVRTGPASPLRKTLKQMSVKEHIYGRAMHPFPPDVCLTARPRLDCTAPPNGSAHVGSPMLQQSMHGAEPMSSLRRFRPPTDGSDQLAVPLRPGIEPKPPSSGAPRHRGTCTMKMRSSQAVKLSPLAPPLPNSDEVREEVREVALKNIRTANENHACPGRMRAISTLKDRLQYRAEQGLPMPTDKNRVDAATLIQACYRGYCARMWYPNSYRTARMGTLGSTGPSGWTTASGLQRLFTEHSEGTCTAELSELFAHHSQASAQNVHASPHIFGLEDNKLKAAYSVVAAVRGSLVEYEAATKIQKWWRGVSSRLVIQAEVARIAEKSATVIQGFYRRYRIACLRNLSRPSTRGVGSRPGTSGNPSMLFGL